MRLAVESAAACRMPVQPRCTHPLTLPLQLSRSLRCMRAIGWLTTLRIPSISIPDNIALCRGKPGRSLLGRILLINLQKRCTFSFSVIQYNES